MEIKPLGIYKKILLVSQAIRSVAKKGVNDYQHYKYATESDLLEEVRGKLFEQGLIIVPSVQSHSVSQRTTTTEKAIITERGEITILDMVFKVVDCETGESIEMNWSGEGSDRGDKGMYKAYTGSVKYFLMKLFMIPTGDDPEKEEKPAVKQFKGEIVAPKKDEEPFAGRSGWMEKK